MKVFVTGATGFVGTAVVRELLAHGHEVLGLARSDAGAAALAATGAEVLRGELDDLASLRRGAEGADGVIHTAFIHDFADYLRSAQADQLAIETLGEVLAGSGRPFVVTSGIAFLSSGRAATEDEVAVVHERLPRRSETTALALAERDVRVSVVRLPPSVHGQGDHGFVPVLIGIAREKGVAAYPGEGNNRWASVHRFDAAQAFRLALEKAPAGARLNAVADEGVPVREIAGAIGRSLHLPVVSVPANQAGEHFGWLGSLFSLDISASSELTRQRFGWQPGQPSLLADLDEGHYFAH